MRVRMRHKVSGTRDGVEWPAPGGEIVLPDDEAVALCSQGMADPVAEDAVETAAAAPRAETRKTSSGRGRPRRSNG